MYNEKDVQQALALVTELSKERKFTQSIDFAINFKNIDFKVPEHRVDLEVNLPNPIERTFKTVLFLKDKTLISELKDKVDRIIGADEIPNLDKKQVKQIASFFDLFFAEPAAMGLIGKHLGQILSPRGKMPKPIPMNANAIMTMITKASKSVKFSNKKGKNLPVVHSIVGTEKMSESQLTENIMTVINGIMPLMTQGNQNIKSMYLKKTMGPAIKLGLKENEIIELKQRLTEKENGKSAVESDVK